MHSMQCIPWYAHAQVTRLLGVAGHALLANLGLVAVAIGLQLAMLVAAAPLVVRRRVRASYVCARVLNTRGCAWWRCPWAPVGGTPTCCGGARHACHEAPRWPRLRALPLGAAGPLPPHDAARPQSHAHAHMLMQCMCHMHAAWRVLAGGHHAHAFIHARRVARARRRASRWPWPTAASCPTRSASTCQAAATRQPAWTRMASP